LNPSAKRQENIAFTIDRDVLNHVTANDVLDGKQFGVLGWSGSPPSFG
jgi:hypothetical protein